MCSLYSTIFTHTACLHTSAKQVTHHLHTIVDTQNRNAEVENRRVTFGRPIRINAIGASRQDNPFRRQFFHFRRRGLSQFYLLIDMEATYHKRNQLLILPSEIQNQNQFIHLSCFTTAKVTANHEIQCTITGRNVKFRSDN